MSLTSTYYTYDSIHSLVIRWTSLSNLFEQLLTYFYNENDEVLKARFFLLARKWCYFDNVCDFTYLHIVSFI